MRELSPSEMSSVAGGQGIGEPGIICIESCVQLISGQLQCTTVCFPDPNYPTQPTIRR